MKILPRNENVAKLGMIYICCALVLMSGPSLQASASSSTASPSVSAPSTAAAAAATATTNVATTPIQSPAVKSGSNPIGQLAGYVKDSFLRMKDGSIQLYTNHQRCNEIRSKQKIFLSTSALSLPESQQKAALKYTPSAGGINYEEFNFLQKGKDDRSKLANIVFMMFFAPNFVPYAFMFFPDMLPSPFAMPANANAKMGLLLPYTKIDHISRERSHAVLQAMIDLERSAKVTPMISNLNPFGRGRTKRMMDKMDQLGHQIGSVLVADQAIGKPGAEMILRVLEDQIYTDEPPKKKATALMTFPKCVVKALGRAMEAPTLNAFLPTFFIRGKVMNSLKQIEIADQFLVDQDIDLTSLSSELLQDACSARLIGGPGRTDLEMIEGLSSWLDLSVKRPERFVGETQKHCNGNMLRAVLLCYNVVEGTRDGRSASYLPRLMYHGQMMNSFQSASNGQAGSERKRRFI